MTPEPDYENKLHQPSGPQIQDRWKQPLRKDGDQSPNPNQQRKAPMPISPQEYQKQLTQQIQGKKAELQRLATERGKRHDELQEARRAMEEAQKSIQGYQVMQKEALDNYQRAQEQESQLLGQITQLKNMLAQSIGQMTGGVGRPAAPGTAA